MRIESHRHLVLLGLRLLLRGWRGGGVGVLLAALVVAAAATSAVGFLGERTLRLLSQQGGELLAADQVVTSPDELPAQWRSQAREMGLETATTLVFPTMVEAGTSVAGAVRLAELKAVSDGYPLRGQLLARDGGTHPPTAGQAWLAPRLARALGVAIGDRVQVGDVQLKVTALLRSEPDHGGRFFYIAPRVLINRADIAASGLLQPYSRVTHRLLLAGPAVAMQRFVDWLRPRLGANASLIGVADARPAMRTALQRARRFLGLAGMVAVLLSAIAVALAARHQTAHNLDLAAMLRCLGASQSQLTVLVLVQLLLLGVLAGAIGATLGWLLHHLLSGMLATLAGGALPAASAVPWFGGVAVSLGTLLAVALPSLLSLRKVAVIRVLRRDVDAGVGSPLWLWLPALLWLLLLVVWQAGELRLAGWVVLGLVATIALLTVMAWLLVRALGLLRAGTGAGWRFGLASIGRRPTASVVQVVGYGLGIMALLLLTVVRADLFQAWQARLPADTPNRFVIDIQPQQRSGITAFFGEQGLPAPHFAPMVRARLTTIDARPVGPDDYPPGRARRLMKREFNLSYAALPVPDNPIVAGKWWYGEQHGQALWSVESGIAEALGIKVGDRLRFMVLGEPVEGWVANLRKVDWDSFQVNFFVVATPTLLAHQPVSYITAFHLPANRSVVLDELIRRFPNLTVIDVAAVIGQVRGIIERVSAVLARIFLFSLLAGVVVMYAAIVSSRDERKREMAVMRALGAGRRQLRAVLIAELAALGLVAGLVGTMGAGLGAWLLASQWLQLDYRPGLQLWLAGPLLAALMVVLVGWLGLRPVLRQPPLAILQP